MELLLYGTVRVCRNAILRLAVMEGTNVTFKIKMGNKKAHNV